MDYKNEKEYKIEQKMKEKLELLPGFIATYFNTLSRQSTCSKQYCTVYNFLEWTLKSGTVDKQAVLNITPADMDEIKRDDIIRYLEDSLRGKYGKENSMSTVIQKKKVLSAMWNYLFLDRYVERNAVQDIPKNKFREEVTIDSRFSVDDRDDHNSVKIPSKMQIESLVENILTEKNEFFMARDLAIVAMLSGTGLRADELIGIDVDNLIVGEDCSYVRTKRKGYIDKYSNVEILPEAIPYIAPYVEIRKNINTLDSALFVSNRNKRISYCALNHVFKGTGITAHMMRHMYATNLYSKTKDLSLVSKMLNHKSVDLTAKTYVGIKPTADFFSMVGECFDNIAS